MNHFKEKIVQGVFLFTACLTVISVLLICLFLFVSGLPAIKEIGFWSFISGTVWRPANHLYGILPMIVGSLYVTVGSLLLGVPIGVLTAIFMAYFCPDKLYKPLKATINLMAGIPSVVYGFFGLVVIVPLIRQQVGGFGMGVLAASILLGIMILPTIISVSEASLRAVPPSYYEGGLALGASHERSVFKAVVPAAKRGILSAIILGVGRAIGETMAVIMVAGNQAVLPQNLTSGVRTLTTNIVMEMGYSSGLHRRALIATGVVLFVFILIINISFSVINKED
ncbi:phosphate ABC transporter permease subunit PstC [Streptococcus henryi]|uniref:phosphate ABC transporter permease subunit PstC n=1 Tax=Streptococcus henryi TaxID=439219 RepID=UPI0003827D92|nr:phosphate ABC transporter permease subunit PstC [Streptococcus henryi]